MLQEYQPFLNSLAEGGGENARATREENMADADQVAHFADLTGCPPEQAQFFLQSAGGNLELAVNEFFLSQEEGAGPMDEGSDGEDEGEDGYEDAEMNMPPLLPVSPSAPAGIPPPSKRPKVEMRQARWLPCSLATPLPPSDAACVWQAPSLPGASAEQLVLLQQVFGLAAKPKDAADTSVLKAPLAPHTARHPCCLLGRALPAPVRRSAF